MAHIAGEGLEGNVPCVLPPGRRVFLRKGTGPVPQVFGWLQRLGGVEEAEMFHVFNMGICFVVIGQVRQGQPGLEFVT